MLKTADETSNNGLYIILNKNLTSFVGKQRGHLWQDHAKKDLTIFLLMLI